MIVLWWLMCHPNAIIITTAPTWRQVSQLLWAEIRDVVKAAPIELFPPGCMPPADCKIKLGEKWYAIGMSSRQPEAIQGYHSDYVLVVVDEASGVSDLIFNAMLGNRASGIVRMLLISNPTRTEGQLFRAFHHARDLWSPIQVDAFDTPNFASVSKAKFDSPDTPTSEKVEMLKAAQAALEAERFAVAEQRIRECDRLTVDYLVQPGWAADILQEYGEDSDSWRVRVRGQFPKGGANQLIPLDHIMAAVERWHESHHWWENRLGYAGRVNGGLDVARMGDNNSCLTFHSDFVVAPQVLFPPQLTTDLSGHVAEKVLAIAAQSIIVDEVGLGGGPCDQLNTLVPGVLGFNGASSPIDTKKFYNLRAECYWKLRELFRLGIIAIPPSDKLIGQLSSIRYKYHVSGRLLIESKDEMLARGIASPDEADSLMMACSQNPFEWTESGTTLTDWSQAFGKHHSRT